MSDDWADTIIDAIVDVIDMRVAMAFANETDAETRNIITTKDFEARDKLSRDLSTMLQGLL